MSALSKRILGLALAGLIIVGAWFFLNAKRCRMTVARVLSDPLLAIQIPKVEPLPADVAPKLEEFYRLLNTLYSERALFETEQVLREGSSRDKFTHDKKLESEFRKWHQETFLKEPPDRKADLVAGMKRLLLIKIKDVASGGEKDHQRFVIRARRMTDLFAQEDPALKHFFCLDSDIADPKHSRDPE